MNPSPEQVAIQVAAIVKNRSDARIVGIYSPGGWTGGDTLTVNGSRWAVVVCRSSLEISERLSAISNGDGLVILTSLPDPALSPTLYIPEEFARRKASNNPFLTRVLAGEHLLLMGNEHESSATR
jgi:hypothetical protein